MVYSFTRIYFDISILFFAQLVSYGLLKITLTML